MEELFGGNNGIEELVADILKANYKNRRLILNEDIDDGLLESICLYILKFNQEDKNIPVENRKPIWIILNSAGGSVTFGMGLLDCIRGSITPVNCLIIGAAASMASYIPMVCNKSYIMPNGVICIHDGQTGIIQTSRKANDTMNFYNSCDERLHGIILDNTNITEDFLEEIADREYYIFAEKAKELGIVTDIVGEDCTLDEVL